MPLLKHKQSKQKYILISVFKCQCYYKVDIMLLKNKLCKLYKNGLVMKFYLFFYGYIVFYGFLFYNDYYAIVFFYSPFKDSISITISRSEYHNNITFYEETNLVVVYYALILGLKSF